MWEVSKFISYKSFYTGTLEKVEKKLKKMTEAWIEGQSKKKEIL